MLTHDYSWASCVAASALCHAKPEVRTCISVICKGLVLILHNLGVDPDCHI